MFLNAMIHRYINQHALTFLLFKKIHFLYIVGESFSSLAFQNRMGSTTVGKMIPETCEALYQALKDDYMQVN